MKLENKKFRAWFRFKKNPISHWHFNGEKNDSEMEYILGTSFDFFFETPIFQSGFSIFSSKPTWKSDQLK